MQDTKNFEYLSLINNELCLTYYEIKRTIYKIVSNKTFDQTNYINKVMRKFIDNVLK